MELVARRRPLTQAVLIHAAACLVAILAMGRPALFRADQPVVDKIVIQPSPSSGWISAPGAQRAIRPVPGDARPFAPSFAPSVIEAKPSVLPSVLQLHR